MDRSLVVATSSCGALPREHTTRQTTGISDWCAPRSTPGCELEVVCLAVARGVWVDGPQLGGADGGVALRLFADGESLGVGIVWASAMINGLVRGVWNDAVGGIFPVWSRACAGPFELGMDHLSSPPITFIARDVAAVVEPETSL